MESNLINIPHTNRESFIVPLDSFGLKSLLDLQLTRNLGLTNHLGLSKNSSDVIPIYSKKPATDTNDYYEFEIKCLRNISDENGFAENLCSIPLENTEFCYICDMAIPSKYLQSHHGGDRHRACAAIISHALHRANQHTMQSVPLSHTDTAAKTQPVSVLHNEAHYCDHCGIVVNVERKDEHELTKQHVRAVKHDRQLQDFLALYTDKVIIENYNFNDASSNKNYEANLKMDTLNLKKGLITEENLEKQDEELDSNSQYKAATVDYDEDFVSLKTLKGKTLLVPTDNYQGFSRGANGIQCRVCREMVVDTVAHKQEPRHVELVTAAVDRHCIRSLTDVLNHCILCNEIIGDPLSHIFNNEQHYFHLKQYIIPSETDEHYCNYCNLTVERALKKRHRNSLDHRLKMWRANTKMHHHFKATEVLCEILCKVCNIVLENRQEYLDEHLQTYDHERNYEAMLVSNKIRKIGEYLSVCEICNTRLIDMEELHHISGAKHLSKIQKWHKSVLLDSKKEHALLKLKMVEIDTYSSDISNSSDEISVDDFTHMVFEKSQPNYLMELSNDNQVKCKMCEVKIDNNTDVINRHIDTTNHKFNYDTTLNYNKLKVLESSDDFKFYCEYCKVQVKDTSEIDHINDDLHSCERDFTKQRHKLDGKMCDGKDFNSNTKELPNVNIAPKLDAENNGILVNKNKNAYYCVICNIYLDKNLKSHYESKDHKNNLDKTFVETPKETNYLMEVKNNSNTCKVCKVKVPNNIQNIQDHIGGRNHNTTYNFLLNLNKIKKVNGGFYCQICKVTLRDTLEIDHVETGGHITKRTNHKTVNNNNKKDLAAVKRDRKSDDETKNNGEKVNSINSYYCDVCEVGVPNYPHNIKEHTSGLRHKANIHKILSDNNIRLKKKNSYHCDLCKIYFSKASVMKHVQSKAHKSLLLIN